MGAVPRRGDWARLVGLGPRLRTPRAPTAIFRSIRMTPTRTQANRCLASRESLQQIPKSAQRLAFETLVEHTSVRLGVGCDRRDEVLHGRITAADEQRQNRLSGSLTSWW